MRVTAKSLLCAIIESHGKEFGMPHSTLTSKGQLTLPKALRERLHLEKGDRIDFKIDEQGRLIGVPLRRGEGSTSAGALRHLAGRRPVGLDEMDEAIRQRYRGDD